MNIIRKQFSDFPIIPDYFKEQIGLGSGSMYEMKDHYIMLNGNDCACCIGDKIIWKIENDVITPLTEWDDYSNIVNIIKFEIPEHISKHYIKLKF